MLWLGWTGCCSVCGSELYFYILWLMLILSVVSQQPHKITKQKQWHEAWTLFFVFCFFLLYNIVLVLPHINMNPPRAYTCSPSWTLQPPPSPYHPSGSSQCTSPKDPVSNLDWQFIPYMILYMFPCHSPKSSHPHPLPQSPKDCFIHLCLFCCLAYRIIVTIFLNSIYMC